MATLSDTILNFGQYKGQEISNVPTQYLEYIVGNFNKGSIRSAAEAELAFRKGESATSKLSTVEWNEQMSLLLKKMPAGMELSEQVVIYNGLEIRIRKL